MSFIAKRLGNTDFVGRIVVAGCGADRGGAFVTELVGGAVDGFAIEGFAVVGLFCGTVCATASTTPIDAISVRLRHGIKKPPQFLLVLITAVFSMAKRARRPRIAASQKDHAETHAHGARDGAYF